MLKDNDLNILIKYMYFHFHRFDTIILRADLIPSLYLILVIDHVDINDPSVTDNLKFFFKIA
jgi:hypothetical protein